MVLSLRPATPSDAALIHGFIVDLAVYEKEPDAVEVTPEILARQLAEVHPPFACEIAHWAGEPAGIALYFFNYSTWRGGQGLHLEDLYVDPGFRGKGIGKALLVRLAQIASDRQCARMEWTVLTWNQPAIDFYESLGAEMLDEWRSYRLADDALKKVAASGRG